ncbi:hypothetical protein AOZ07_03000 [Glutamicibacter halophytocola]|nr:hypothetical protein AOZ07_03000 [Glutamicibacter halophytocola]
MLNTSRDMQPIQLGRLNNIDHFGLEVFVPGNGGLSGRIAEITHGFLTTQIKVRDRGLSREFRSDPQTVIKIEAHLTDEGE